jgi:hypothetical protein
MRFVSTLQVYSTLATRPADLGHHNTYKVVNRGAEHDNIATWKVTTISVELRFEDELGLAVLLFDLAMSAGVPSKREVLLRVS